MILNVIQSPVNLIFSSLILCSNTIMVSWESRTRPEPSSHTVAKIDNNYCNNKFYKILLIKYF
jgi:hypothetical protein